MNERPYGLAADHCWKLSSCSSRLPALVMMAWSLRRPVLVQAGRILHIMYLVQAGVGITLGHFEQ
jgi:hypothetical protein